MAHTPHTQRNIDTHRHMHTHTHTDRYIYHFYILHILPHLAYMPKIQILYLAYHRLTHGQTLRHAHTWIHTCTETLTHRYRYTDICMFVYKHTHTHTDVHVGNLRKLLLQIHFEVKIDQTCYFKHEFWGKCYLKPFKAAVNKNYYFNWEI